MRIWLVVTMVLFSYIIHNSKHNVTEPVVCSVLCYQFVIRWKNEIDDIRAYLFLSLSFVESLY